MNPHRTRNENGRQTWRRRYQMRATGPTICPTPCARWMTRAPDVHAVATRGFQVDCWQGSSGSYTFIYAMHFYLVSGEHLRHRAHWRRIGSINVMKTPGRRYFRYHGRRRCGPAGRQNALASRATPERLASDHIGLTRGVSPVGRRWLNARSANRNGAHPRAWVVAGRRAQPHSDPTYPANRCSIICGVELAGHWATNFSGGSQAPPPVGFC